VIGNDSSRIAGHHICLDLGSLLCLLAAVMKASGCIAHVSGIFFYAGSFRHAFRKVYYCAVSLPRFCGCPWSVEGCFLVLFFFCVCLSYLGGLVSGFISFLVIYTGCSYHGDSLCFCEVGIYE
jgi:hypothetical protein